MLVRGQNGAGRFEDGRAELAPSVSRLGSHLEPVDRLLAEAAEGRLWPVDEHAAGIVLEALHEVAHLVHFNVRVRVVRRVPSQSQLGRTDVDDAHVRDARRNGRLRRHGNVDKLVLVGRDLIRHAVVGKHLETVRRDGVEAADGHFGVVERSLPETMHHSVRQRIPRNL